MTRRSLSILLIGTGGVLALVATIAAAQGTSAVDNVMITQKTAFEWPIVAGLLAVAFSAAGIAVSMRSHHARPDIHHTTEELDGVYRRRGECDLVHGALMDKLGGISDDIGDIKAGMGLPTSKHP